ncbi:Lysosomal acid phosphatase [Frankliniella fusca]|uniref:acid phosphatase n=1 Tax=Frankliniella fusca TaxID=407009 RepID=A0AAE1HQV2_9NEOP|nr:Lysosomal acid phosphatase [Frankliniella fusca]
MRQLKWVLRTCALILILFGAVTSASLENEESELVMVNVLFRHGDRTPVNPYPFDPYRNASYWTTGWGQLTTVGMQQHYELGLWLRKRYISLLKNDYSKADLYIQSTDVDRTLMSAESNLAGLFPPRGSRMFEPGLKWQPIPVHTIPEHLDHLLAMKKPCPRYDAEFAKARNLPEIKKLEKDHQDLFNYLTFHTGSEVRTIENAEYIHSTLFIESLKNLTLPEWTKKVYPEPLRMLAQWSFAIPAYTPELQRLKGGPLVKEWIEHFNKKRSGTLEPNRKMYVYSAHDTTIANILSTLGLFERHCPPYTSTVLAELHKIKNSYYVSIFYKNSSVARPMTLKGCSQLCELDKFISLLKPVIPDNWEKECHYNLMFSSEDLNDLSISALATSGILSLILLAVLVIGFFKQRRQVQDQFRYQTVSTNADA